MAKQVSCLAYVLEDHRRTTVRRNCGSKTEEPQPGECLEYCPAIKYRKPFLPCLLLDLVQSSKE